MCARRSKALDAAAALTALGRGEGKAEKRQPRQAMAAPGRVHFDVHDAGRVGRRAGRGEAGPEDLGGAAGLAHGDGDSYGDPHGDAHGDAQADERPSKTELKKAAHDMQTLGDALAAMSPERLAALPMDDTLRDAIVELRRTRSHEGLRRQRQYVGKLMRRADIEPLAQAVAEAALGSARQTMALHRAEALRLELVGDDGALTRFMSEHPGCDVQQLRSLIRAARKEAALPPEQRHGRAWRDLFQFIKPYVMGQHHDE